MDIEDRLRQFQWEDPDPELKERISRAVQAAAARRRRPWPTWYIAAAAALLLAVGASLWMWNLAERGHNRRDDVARREKRESSPATVEILGGQGRIVPVAADARFTVLDSETGRIRLEKGEVLVELEAGSTRFAQVETPAGTARGQKTSFYAHCSGTDHALLAVAVLGGKVEMSTPHGHTTCSAGDVAFAQTGSAPHKHSGSSKYPKKYHRGFCPFVSTLGLIYRPEVQAELKLSDAQKNQLHRPGTDERREICRFFQGLHGISPQEWSKTTNEFCVGLEAKVARTLLPEQRTRLQQIVYRQEGYFALLRSELVRDLKVEQVQQDAIERILREFADKRRNLLDRNLPAAQWSEAINAAWQRSLGQAEKLLTEEQKKRWHELIGAAVDLPIEF